MYALLLKRFKYMSIIERIINTSNKSLYINRDDTYVRAMDTLISLIFVDFQCKF